MDQSVKLFFCCLSHGSYLFTQCLDLLLAVGCGHTTCAMPILMGWWVDMVIWLVKNG